MDDAQPVPVPAPVEPDPVEQQQAAIDAELASLKQRCEQRVADAEAKAADAEKKSQLSSNWLDAHLAAIKAILPQ